MESTKKIDERRKLRAELRSLKEKKEKLISENGNEKPNPTVSSKFVMRVGSTKREDTDARHQQRDDAPAKKENIEPEKPKTARSTFSFKVSSSEKETKETSSYSRKTQRNEEPRSEGLSYRRHQTNHEEAPLEEKRARRNREINNNEEVPVKREPLEVRVKQAEKPVEAPKRMTRRASLAELFKIDKDAVRPGTAPPNTSSGFKITVPPPAEKQMNAAETQKDAHTKQGLIQSLTRLRSRRRSVREIERKEELEGLMYVKTGDSVKLVSTSKGDEEASSSSLFVCFVFILSV